MALSVINYFFLQIPEARVPLMIMDGLVVWGLTIMESRLKREKAARLEAENMVMELQKKETHALKSVEVQQRKLEHKKQHMDQKNSHNKPRSPINQPDRNNKLR